MGKRSMRLGKVDLPMIERFAPVMPASRSLGRLTFGAVSWGVLLACAGGALANPMDPTVRGGSVNFVKPDTKTLEIRQSTDKAAIDWRSFSIGKGETTKFVQPNANSVTLNRVTGNESSQLLGDMTANGQVYLINRNGIVIGKDAHIDVTSLVATTADIKNEDFMAGRLKFDGKAAATATVVNKGTITVADRGLAALVAPSVRNEGTIRAKVGQVVLGGAQSFTLDPHGDGLFAFTIDKASPASGDTGALVQNAGRIVAEGGNVLLSARTAEGVVDRLIENTGVIEARSATRKGGKIVLDAGDASGSEAGSGGVLVAGTLDAGGTSGGAVTVQGKTVEVAAAAKVAADGIAGNGGAVRLTASESTKVAGRVTAKAAKDKGGKGGSVVATAAAVTLASSAKVDVSGSTGGGTALIGGNERGVGPERNAQATRVEKGASIKADAGTSGDGGRVVVWSDGGTAYGGTISAKGGHTGGDGGFAEVSGKQQLVYRGKADLTARRGKLGSLLLDPDQIIIQGTGANDVELPDIAVGDGGAAVYTISAASLVNALDGANVSLAATSLIAVRAAVDASGNAGRGNLTLTATGGSITSGFAISLRGSLTATANFMVINANVTTEGDQTYNATTRWGSEDAIFRTNGGNFRVNGLAEIYSLGIPAVSIDSRGAGTDGFIEFTDNIFYARGPSTLVMNAGSNGITVAGQIGQVAEPMQAVTLTGSSIAVGSVFTRGNQSYNGDLVLTGLEYVTSAGGSILVDGPTRISNFGTTEFRTEEFIPDGGSFPDPGGRISFTGPGTIDGSGGLSVIATRNTVEIAGAIGGILSPSSVTVSGTEVTTRGAATVGAQTYTGTTSVALGGDYTAGGDILVNGPAILTADTSMRVPNESIALSDTLTGNGFSMRMEGETVAASSTGITQIGGAVTGVRDLTMAGSVVVLGEAAITGNMTLTSAGPGVSESIVGILLAGDITTAGGDFTATGRTTLLTDISVDTRGAGGADGAIAWRTPGSINSSNGNNFALALRSGTGNTDLEVAVGQGDELDSLTIDGARITLGGNVATVGSQLYTGVTRFAERTYETSDDGNIIVTGAATLTGATGTTTTFNADGDLISFSSTIDGASALAMTAGNRITLSGAVGGTVRPDSIDANAANIDSNGARTTGNQRWNGSISLNGLYTTDGGTFLVTGNTTLAGDTSVLTDGGAVTFALGVAGTIDDFTVDAATGTLDFGGALTGIADLALTAASIPGLGALTTAGSQSYTVTSAAGTFVLDGDRATGGGTFTVNGPTSMQTSALIDTTGAGTPGAVLFDGTIDGNPSFGSALTIRSGTAATRITGAAGNANVLDSLDIAAGSIALEGDVHTVGAQTYAGDLAVSGALYEVTGTGGITTTGATTVTGAGTQFLTQAGDILFQGPGTIDGPAALTLTAIGTADVRIAGAVGATTALAGLTVTGAAIETHGAVTNGVQSYTGAWSGEGAYTTNGGAFSQAGGAMTLLADTTIATGGGALTFADVVGGGFNFGADADTAELTVTGALGNINNLTLRGASIFGLAGVTTTGFQSYTATDAAGIVVLGGTMTTNGGAFTVNGDTALRSDTIVDSRGVGTDGTVLFDGTIGNSSDAASLTIRSGAADATIAGAVGTLANGIGALLIESNAIDLGGSVFTLAGQTYTALTQATFSGAAYQVTGTGGIAVSGDAILDAAGGATAFTSAGASVSFAGTVDGAIDLTVTAAGGGAVIFGDAVGDTTALASLVASGTSVSTNDVTTTGLVSITGNWLAGGTYTTDGDAFTVTGNTTMRADVSVDTRGAADDGAILLDGSVSQGITGTLALTLRSGDSGTRISGPVGPVAVGIGSVDIAGATIQLDSSVDTTGDQTYVGALTVGGTGYTVLTAGGITVTGATTATRVAGSTFTTQGEDLVFQGAGTIDGPGGVALNALGGADVRVAGAIGGTTPLAFLTASGTAIETHGAVTNGVQTFTGAWTGDGDYLTNGGAFTQAGGAMTLAGDVRIVTGNADVTFGAVTGGNNDFTVDAGTAPLGGGSIAGVAALSLRASSISGFGAVATDGAQTYTIVGTGGTFVLDGDRTTNGGAFTVNGQTELAATALVDTTGALASGAILFDGGIAPQASLTGALTLRSGTAGSRIAGDVGAPAAAIDALDIAGATIQLGGSVYTVGGQTYAGALTVAAGDYAVLGTGAIAVTGATIVGGPGVSNFTTGGGNIVFGGAGTIDGPGGANLAATGGLVDVGGAVGGTAPLASFGASGTTITTHGVVTSGGAQTFTGAFTGDGDYLTNGGAFTQSGGSMTLAGATRIVTAGGDAGFGAVIGAGNDFTADADTGLLTGSASLTGIGNLTLRAATIQGLGAVVTNGFQSYTAVGAGGVVVLDGDRTTNGGAFTITGQTSLAADSTVDTRGAGTAGAILFDGDVVAPPSTTGGLVLRSGTASSRIAGDVGTPAEAIDALDIQAQTIRLDGSVTTFGNQTYDGALTVAGAAYTALFTGAITVTGPTTVTGPGVTAFTSRGADIEFQSTIDGPGGVSLTAQAAGSAPVSPDIRVLGTVGGTTQLASFAATAENIETHGVITNNGPQTFNGAWSGEGQYLTNGGVFTQSGGSMTLLGATGIVTEGGNIGFGPVIGGGNDFTADADTGLLTGSASLTGIGNLTLRAATIQGLGAVTTNGFQSYTAVGAGGVVVLDGDRTTNGGAFTITGETSLTATTVVNTVGGATAGAILFDGGIAPDASGLAALTLRSGTAGTRIAGNVGSVSTGIAALDIAAQTIRLDGSVSTAGDQIYTGALTVAGSGYTVRDAGGITVTGPTTATRVAGSTFTARGEDVVFQSTIDGPGGVGLVAFGGGSVRVDGAIGGTTPLAYLSASGATIETHGAVTAAGGEQSFTGAWRGEGQYLTNGGAFTQSGGSMTLLGDTGIVTDGGNIAFGAVIGGGNDFTADADTGLLTGSASLTGIGNLTLRAATIQGLGAVTTNGFQSYTAVGAGGGVVLDGDRTTNGGAFTINGETSLTATTVIDTQGAGGDGAIGFTGGIAVPAGSAVALTLRGGAADARVDGAVGSATDGLASFTAAANTIRLGGSVFTIGDQSYTAAAGTTFAGPAYRVLTEGGIAVTGAAVIAGATTFTSRVDDVSFGGAVDGPGALTLTATDGGSVTVGGAAGAAVPLASFTATGDTVATNGVTTGGGAVAITGDWQAAGDYATAGGAFTVNGATALLATVDIDTRGAVNGGTILLDGSVAQGTSGVAALEMRSGNADIRVAGNVGTATAGIGLLRADGRGVQLDGQVFTAGNQIYAATTAVTFGGTVYRVLDNGGIAVTGDSVLAAGAATTFASVAGDVRFGGAVDGAVALIATAAGGGAVAFEGAVGGATAIASLVATGVSVETNGVATAGGVLTVNGAWSAAGIHTTAGGAVTVTGDTGLRADVTVDSRNGAAAGDIFLDGNVNPAGGAVAGLTLRGDGASARIGGDVGTAVDGLSTLAITAATIGLDGSVRTDGSQRYTGDLTVAGAVYQVLDTGSITVTGNTVSNGAPGAGSAFIARGDDVVFEGAIDGPGGVAATTSGGGSIRIAGLVGGTVAPEFLTASGVAVETHGVTTSGGAQTYAGVWSGEGDYVTNGGAFSQTGGDLTLAGNVRILTAGGDIGFGPVVGGGNDFTADADTGALAGGGPINNVGELFLRADSIQGFGVVVTTGAQTYTATGAGGVVVLDGDRVTNGGAFTVNGRTALAADTPIDTRGAAGDGAIRFNGAVAAGDFGLSANSGAAATRFTGDVGTSTTGIGFLAVQAGGIQLDGLVTTTGGQIYTSGAPITFGGSGYRVLTNGGIGVNGDAVLAASGPMAFASRVGSVAFSGAVDGAVALTATATDGGSVAFGGAIGGTTPLTALTASGVTVETNGIIVSGGPVAITGGWLAAGDNATSGGAFTVTGATTLQASVAVDTRGTGTDGAIRLDGGVTQAAAGPADLILRSGTANAEITGPVGTAADGIASLTVAGNVVTLGGPVFTFLDQTYSAADQVVFSGASYQVLTNGGIAVTGEAVLNPAGGASSFVSRVGDVTFGGTVDGAVALTATATDGGSVAFQGAIGGTTPVLSFAASGLTVETNGLTVAGGAIAITGDWTAAGLYETDGGSFTVTGDTTLRASATIDTNGTGGSGAILLDGAVADFTAGTSDLALNSGTAATRITGPVGAAGRLASLAIDGGTIRLDDSVNTAGSQTYTGALTVAGATYSVTDEGGITVTGTTLVVGSSSGFTSIGGDVVFQGPGTIDGPGGVAAIATDGGVVRIAGAVGGTAAPAFLVASGATIETHGVTTSGGVQAYTGAWTGEGNYVTNGGLFTQSGGTMTLAGDVSIATGGGIAGFGAVIGGGNDFSVDADAGGVFGAGSITGVADLTLRGGTIDGLGAVVTNGFQSYTAVGASGLVILDGDRTTNGGTFTVTGRALLDANVRVDTQGSGAAGAILFDGGIGQIGGVEATLILRGGGAEARITGSVGEAANGIGGLDIAAGTIRLDDSVFTLGDQSYAATGSTRFAGTAYQVERAGGIAVAGAALMAGDSTFTSRGGDIRFGGTVDGPGAATLEANDGGSAIFAGAVGGTTALASLTITGTAILTNGVVTDGDQGYFGAWTGTGAYLTNGGAFRQDLGDMTLAGDVRIVTAGGAVGFGPVLGGGNDFTVDADTGLLTAGGTITGVGNLSLRADSIQGLGTVVTDGAQTYTATGAAGVVVLDGDRTTNGGAFTINGQTAMAAATEVDTRGVSGAGTILFDGGIAPDATGTAALTLRSGTAATRIAGDVGTATVGIGGLDIAAETIRLDGSVTTTGGQSYAGALTVNGADYAVLDAGGVTVTGTTTVNRVAGTRFASNGGDLLFQGPGTIDGTGALTLAATDGAVRILGAVGGTVPLASLTASGTTVETNGITVAGGAIAITGGWTAAGLYTTDGGAFTVTGDTALRANTSVDTRGAGGGGAILLDGTVADASGSTAALTLNSGAANTRIASDVGAGTGAALASLAIDGAAIQLDGAVTTTGAQAYTGAVTVGGATYTVTDAGGITVTGPTVVAGSSSGFISRGGDVVFQGVGTIDGPGGVAAIANDGGAVRILGVVGGTVAPEFLVASGTAIETHGVTTSGGVQAYTGAWTGEGDYVTNGGGFTQTGGTMTLAGDTSIVTGGGNAGFGAVIGGTNDFSVDADTGRLFAGGSITGVADLTLRAAVIDGLGDVTTTGFQSFTSVGINGITILDGDHTTNGGAFTVTGRTALVADVGVDTRGSAGDGAIRFTSTVESGTGSNLTLRSGTGQTAIDGAAGEAAVPLGALAIDAGAIRLGGSVFTAGNQAYTGALTVSGASYTVTDTGGITVTGPTVIAGGSSGFTSRGGDVVFQGVGTIDGPGGLAAFANDGGAVRILGAVGGTVAPAFLVASGATIETHGVTTSGGVQVYTGAWTGEGDYRTNGGGFTQAGGTMTLAGDTSIATAGGIIGFGPVTGGGNDFSVDADTGRLSGAGVITGVADLTLRAAVIDGLGDVTTTGFQSFTSVGINGITVLNGDHTTNGGAFTVTGRTALVADVTVDTQGSAGDGAIRFTNTVESGTGSNLTLRSGGALTAIDGAVGEAAVPLGALAIDAGTIQLGGSVFTGGDQAYTAGTATFGGAEYRALTDGGIAVDAAAVLAPAGGAVAFAGNGGDVRFAGTVDGAAALTATATDGGAVRFLGAVGATTPLTALTASGSTIESGDITTAGAVDLTGAWTVDGTVLTNGGAFTLNGVTSLAADTAIDTRGIAGAGTIVLGGPVVQISATDSTLTLRSGTAAARIGGNVGTPTTGIGALVIDGGTILLDGLVSTNAGQTYTAASTLFAGAGYRVLRTGNVTVNGAAVLTASDVAFASAGGDVRFNGTVDGAGGLRLDAGGGGSVFLIGQVGGVTPLAFLAATGQSVETRGVTTAAGGFQTYTGNWNAAGTYTTNGGAFTIPGRTTLLGDLVVATNGGAVGFTGTIAGAGFNLSVDSGGGLASLTGIISDVGDILVRGDRVRITTTTTRGTQTYIATGSDADDGVYFGSTYTFTGAFTASGHTFLGDDVIVQAAPGAAGPGSIAFNGPIDAGLLSGGTPAVPPSLTIRGGGYDLGFGGIAGGARALGALSISNVGLVSNEGAAVADRGFRFATASFDTVRNIALDGLEVSDGLDLRNILGASRFGTYAVPSTLIGNDRRTAYRSSDLTFDSSAAEFVTINGCRVGGDVFCEVTLGLTRPPELVDVLPLPRDAFINPAPFVVIEPSGGCVYAGASDCVLDPNAIATMMFGLDSLDLDSERLRFLDSGNEERW